MRIEKTLFLMCGLAFAGKSTLANAIAVRTGADIVSLDEINSERNLHGGKGIPDSEWAESHRIALQRLNSLAQSGRAVIIDDTNCFRWLRDNYRSTVEPYGYRCVVLLINISPELARERALQNALDVKREEVIPEIMSELINKFEYPDPGEEDVVVYSPAEPFSRWFARNFPDS